MKILIYSAILLISFSLSAQEEETSVELPETDEVVESNPLENADEAISSEETAEANPVAESTPAPVPAPVPAEGTQAVKTQLEAMDDFNPYESHWYTTLGFEAMEYNLPFSYTGDRESFKEEYRALYGGRIGVGGELYLGAGFMTSTRLEGYYMGTLFESAKTADPEVDEDVATVKDSGQIYGGDIVQTLSFMWELKTKNPLMGDMTYLTVEPFVEAGIGRAWAYNQKEYSYDSGSCPTCVQEEYDQSFTDELTNVKFGGGINFTARSGFFLTLKVTQNQYDITKRKTKGYYYADDDTRTTINDSDPDKALDSIMVYSLGGGYKF